MDRQPAAISTTNHTAPPSEAPVSPSAQAGADRCMRHTNSWTPSFQRRQSWSPEERKHEMHMDKIEQVSTGPGFTEREGF
ncbi:hypothetical protein NW752_004433 [Fusarium irregulare]|uniref:Uncharacterized protein n=1 Tax=Fusarium irregulare TaxID=2494466 RepID=A0A9W8U9E3_9HYPO|nr:hypothetical protein NW766_007340 [Fusarium irregulare]KAJ4021425.1 hypothetical protein NW752_004433 [Fusarium irregulare]